MEWIVKLFLSNRGFHSYTHEAKMVTNYVSN